MRDKKKYWEVFVEYLSIKALVYANMLISMPISCEYMLCELGSWLKRMCFNCEQRRFWDGKGKKKVEKKRKKERIK